MQAVQAGDVAEVRSVSRRFVRELGLLSEVHRDTGSTIAQCHLLIELERRGGSASVSELAAALLLDKSTVSRTILSMRRKKWLRLAEDARDRRRKIVGMTRSGERILERVHRVADHRVEEALRHLSPRERRTVARGLSIYARALQRARTEREYAIRPIESADNRAITAIIRRVSIEFGTSGPGGPTADIELDNMAEAYPGDDRQYFVIENGQRILGGAGFAPLRGGTPATCELRKMYLISEARGQGLGRALLDHCLEQARAYGFKRCYLETTARMRSARALYTQVGFAEVPDRMGETGHSQCEMQYIKRL